MPQVQLCIDAGGDDGVAHVFLVLTPTTGTQLRYGLNPRTPGSSVAATVVTVPEGLEYQSNRIFDVSESVFTDLQAKLAQSPASLVNLNVPRGAQQVAWAVKVLTASGVITSSDATLSDALIADLQKIAMWEPVTQGMQVATNAIFTNSLPAPTPSSVLVALGPNDAIKSTGIAFWDDRHFVDLDGDGFRELSGWVGNTAHIMVYDSNNDGHVDGGPEIIGRWMTPQPSGSQAWPLDGFKALALLDQDSSGSITEADGRGQKLLFWVDANDDGMASPDPATSTELTYWEDKNTTTSFSASTVSTANRVEYSGGNVKTAESVWALTSGQTTSAMKIVNIQLVRDSSYSIFTNPPVLSPAENNLPMIYGSGWVLSLPQAVKLGGTNGDALRSAVTAFNQSTSRADQDGQLLTDVLKAWASTSPKMVTSTDFALIQNEAGVRTAGNLQTSKNGNLRLLPDGMTETTSSSPGNVTVASPEGQKLLEKMHILEVFNGTRFVQIRPDNGAGTGNFTLPSPDAVPGVDGSAVYSLHLSTTQIAQINDAWKLLTKAAFKSLLLQSSQLKPYLELISANIDTSKQALAFSGASMDAKFDSDWTADRPLTFNKAIDLLEYGSDILEATGTRHALIVKVAGWMQAVADASWITTRLTALRATGVMSMSSTASDDLFVGLSTNDTFSGQDGDDIVVGMAGDDVLNGGPGNDLLVGGPGNDYLRGGGGNDTYLWGVNQGKDTLSENNSTLITTEPGNNDRLLINGVLKDGVRFYRPSSTSQDLIIKILSTNDTLTIERGLDTSIDTMRVEFIIFTKDGTTQALNFSDIRVKAVAGTSSAETIYGNESDDTITALEGDDIVYGGAGDDNIDGGAGADYLQGDAGNDTLKGGVGNDRLRGSAGNDTYVWGRGLGNDRISETGTAADSGDADRIRLEGVLPTEVTFSRTATGDLLIKITPTTSGAAPETLLVERGLAPDSPQMQVEFIDFVSVSGASSVVTDTWSLERVAIATMTGTDASENIYGSSSNDTIEGNGGNDFLYGGPGDDTLNGGSGNDWMRGGAGDDTYVWSAAGGNDRISETDSSRNATGADRLLVHGLLDSEVRLTRTSNDDLIILNLRGGNTLVIERGLSDQYSHMNIELLVFDNGTRWSLERMQSEASLGSNDSETLYGSSRNDVLSGLGGSDKIYGRGGDDNLRGDGGSDSLYGEKGDDTLDGGAGNDYLRGGEGSDTYHWGQGGGNDRISESPQSIDPGDSDLLVLDGLTLSQVALSRQGSDNLQIKIIATNETLIIECEFSAVAGYMQVETLQFSDGKTLDIEQMRAEILRGTDLAQTLYGFDGDDVIDALGGDDTVFGRAGNDTLKGGAGNDTLMGEAGNDVLEGGAGDDLLRGGAGDDTYRWGSNQGSDRITESLSWVDPGMDTVILTDLKFNDVSFSSASYNSLVVLDKVTGATLTIYAGLAAGREYAWVERFEFADGTQLSLDDVRGILASPSTDSAASTPMVSVVGVDPAASIPV